MQLKKLEMCGFKSFANRTEILFEPGVTCIVGPNGCGKSNVVDAIKWVLGTLSHKAVRGDEMLDVIFKGAEGVAPMGFAEVSLTLDNSDKTLAIEYEDVTIARRLYRSGESEYYINRNVVRLKDIRELLYGTGIGTDNYSIIEQGKIDRLVLTNPRERRLIFDEASGISKYRAKKRETESRLEKVTNDLTRLGDIVREVQRELRSVRAQAGRAQRYRELTEELARKRKKLLFHDDRILRQKAEEIARRMAELEERRGAVEATVGARRVELEEKKRALTDLEARGSAKASELASGESKAGYLAQSVESSEKRRRELGAEKERLSGELEAQERKIAEVTGLLEAQKAERGQVGDEIARLAAGVEEAQAAMEDANRECARVNRELERCKAEALELAHKDAQYKGERQQVKGDLEGLAARLVRVEARNEAVSKEHADVAGQIETIRAEKSALEIEIADLMTRKRAEDEALVALKAQFTELEQELRGLREDRERRSSRRETLRDFELQMEGLDTGVKELLRAQLPGVLGTIADYLDVTPEQLPLVEAALGEDAGTVVCESMEAAVAALRYAKEHKLGRARVLAREVCTSGEAADSRLPIGIRRVSDLVNVAPEHAEWVKGLLGRILLVESDETAQAVLASGLAGLTMVTPAGDVYQPTGVVSTGPRGGAGILSRKTELRRLELEIEDYDKIITEREARRNDAKERIRTAEEKLEMLRHLVYEKNIALHDAASRDEQLGSRATFLQGELEHARIERDEIGVQTKLLEERGAALDKLMADLDELKGRIAGEIAGLGMTLARYDEARTELTERLTKARVERAQVEEKLKAVDKRIEMMEANLREATAASGRTAELIQEVAGRLESVAQEIEERRAEQAKLIAAIETMRAESADLDARRAASAAEVEESAAYVRASETDLTTCMEEVNQLRVDEGEQRVKLENHAARARDEGVDLSEPQPEDPEEAAIDWTVLATEVDELRRKVNGFGAVNVDALNQLEDLERRETEMIGQHEDLTSTKAELEELIKKLNRESKELFDKTFAIVREHFNVIFRKLFNGGKSDIIVEAAEGVDPMDQGLQIMAKPPAKDFTSINLLSGGERSMTALALVMALFRANPSPFCVLDEADAALDEKNVERYAALVNEFVEETQFILITHNKRTMSVADVMYGVTMETPGVSKRVAVNMAGDDHLSMLREKKIAARRERQQQLAEAAQSATAVLEAPPESDEPEAAATTGPEPGS